MDRDSEQLRKAAQFFEEMSGAPTPQSTLSKLEAFADELAKTGGPFILIPFNDPAPPLSDEDRAWLDSLPLLKMPLP
jgi:hypothetical protein